MEKCPKCGWFHTRECVPMTPPPPVMGEGQTKAHNTPITRTPILISAMRLLARDIQSEDGVANAAIAEAADRLEEFQKVLTEIALASDDHIRETDLQDIAIAALDPEVHHAQDA